MTSNVLQTRNVQSKNVRTSAIVSHEAEASSPIECVSLIQESRSWYQKARPCERNLGVEVVVRQIHSVFRVLTIQIGWPLQGARKALVGGTERCLPYLAKLVQNVWHLSLIGVVVHEDDCSLSHENHVRQGGQEDMFIGIWGGKYCCISLGQHSFFRREQGALRRCLGAPDLLEQRQEWAGEV